MSQWQRAVAMGILILGDVYGQPAIQLRNRAIDTTVTASAASALTQTERVRLLVQYDEASAGDLAVDLASRGVQVLNYIPKNALIVSAPADVDWTGSGVRWSAPLSTLGTADKLSADADSPDPAWLVVDFKPLKKFKKPVSLVQIKADKRLADMDLVRLGRLSVGAVKEAEWKIVMEMAETKL